MDPVALARLIRPERIRQLTFDLVRIPSPTGQARACTAAYAEHLRGLGLQVRLETGNWPEHPTAVAVLPGRGGKCVQFDGHTDTVPLAHPAPRIEGDRVIGRGAYDMKGSLAVMAEVAAVLVEAGVTPPGDLMLTAHDLHEAPGGLGESITDLCRRGIHGDVCIVAELGREVLPVVGRGMAIFELWVRRDGELAHEVTGAPNPLDTAVAIAGRLRERRTRMAEHDERYVGPETVFLGQLHAGSFYNQIPTEAFLNGTWRFSPRKTFDQVRAELDALLAEVSVPEGVRLDLRLFQVRPSFALDPAEPMVAAVQAGYAAVHGRELPLGAEPAVCDVPVFVREGGIPCIGHGPEGHGAHGEPEWIDAAAQVRTTEVYLHALAHYWQALS